MGRGGPGSPGDPSGPPIPDGNRRSHRERWRLRVEALRLPRGRVPPCRRPLAGLGRDLPPFPVPPFRGRGPPGSIDAEGAASIPDVAGIPSGSGGRIAAGVGVRAPPAPGAGAGGRGASGGSRGRDRSKSKIIGYGTPCPSLLRCLRIDDFANNHSGAVARDCGWILPKYPYPHANRRAAGCGCPWGASRHHTGRTRGFAIRSTIASASVGRMGKASLSSNGHWSITYCRRASGTRVLPASSRMGLPLGSTSIHRRTECQSFPGPVAGHARRTHLLRRGVPGVCQFGVR